MKRASLATLALAVGIGLLLAACGNKETATAVTTANVTFRSDPTAEVWIDGKPEGSTPIVIAVSAGPHAVALKAEGFDTAAETMTVDAGKDVTVDTALRISGTDEPTLERLTKALGIGHEKLAEASTHRGGSDSVATLFWPRRDVRKDALGTYRIVVTSEYEADGFIEFHKGRKLLHREAFDPQSFLTERALPAAVIEAIKSGSQITWGLYYDEKRRKDITTKFKVVRNTKADRALKKLERRKLYRRATPLMKEMAKIDVLKNYRLYSEALVASLGVLNTWPDTDMPYAGIVDVLGRLKLKDSELYAFAAAKRGGRGNRAGQSGGGLGAIGTSRQRAQAGLPPSGVAPVVRRDETAAAPTPGGGMSVRPTEEAQKREPGPIEPTPEAGAAGSDGATSTDPRARDADQDALRRQGEVRDLRESLAAEEARLVEAREAEARVQQANERASRMAAQLQTERDAAELAAQTLAQKVATHAPEAELAAARAAAEEAAGRVALLEQEVTALEEDRRIASEQAQEILKETGPSEEAAEAAEQLRREIEAAEHAQGPAGPGVPGTGVPGTGSGVPGTDPQARPPEDPSVGGAQPDPAEHAFFLENARQEVTNAEQQAQLAQDGLQAANQAIQAANTALQQAEATMETALAGGDATVIEAARRAVAIANGDLGRAQMEVERGNADVDRTIRNLAYAQAGLLRAETPAADK